MLGGQERARKAATENTLVRLRAVRLPSLASETLGRALSSEPDVRPASPADLVALLSAAAREESAAAKGGVLTTTAWLLGLLGLLLGVAGLAWLLGLLG